LAAVVAGGSVGCKGGEDDSTTVTAPSGPGVRPSAPAGEKMTIALMMKTMTNPFFQKMYEGAEEKAKELGVELKPLAAERETSIAEQADQVRNMIQAEVDAILVAPAGSKEIVPALLQSTRAGIITINLDNRVDPETMADAGLELDAYVGADNEQGGYMAGECLAELMGGEGVATMLEGIPSADNAIARREGFERAMREVGPGIELIRPFQSAHWEQEEGYECMTNLLQSRPDVTGLFCANDMMALGAMRAIADADRTDTMHVVSYDNLPEVQDALRDGELKGTIEQHPEVMGAMGVEYAHRLWSGETLSEDEKEFYVNLELITPESVR